MSSSPSTTAGHAARGRSLRVTPVVAALTVAAVLLVAVQLLVVRPAIEEQLAARATGALREAGLMDVEVSMQGRNAVITGSLSRAQREGDVETVLAGVAGVRQIEVRTTSPAAPAEPTDSTLVGAPRVAVDTADPAGDVVTPEKPPASADEGSRLLVAGLGAPEMAGLSFVVGSAELTDDSLPALSVLADFIKADTTGRQFVIRTHTDTVGDAAYNQWLSEKRAGVICDGLLGHGVPEARLAIVGVGESEPLVNPEVSEGDRATNRRVEILPAR